MNLPYAYTPQIWPPVITVLLLIVLATYSWRRRSVPGALPFTIALLFGVLWMLGISLEAAAVDAPGKIFWIKFQAAWLLPSATGVTSFLLEYARPGRWLTRRNLALLSIPCLLNLGMILTDDLHHLAWQGFMVDTEVTPLNGPGNWAFLVYAYGLGLVNLVVLAWLFIRSSQHHWPVALMLAGQIAGRVVYGLEAFGVIQTSLQIEVIAFWFPIPMYVIALFGFRILNPIPLARQTAIEQMRDGMLVVDRDRRVTSLNPAAEKILGTSLKQVQGKLLEDLLPNLPELSSRLNEIASSSEPTEMNLTTGAETRRYELVFSPLRDFRGLPIGQLLLLHDVTEQRRSQVQILEQQRALSMMNERERLARELHDSLGQVLGYAGFQMEAVSKLIQDGQAQPAVTQLNRMAGVIREAHADVREYILDLHAAPAPHQPFFPALRRYLEGYSRNYGIQAQMEVAGDMGDEIFPPDIRLQVYRIMQEALSNTRKHGHARCVKVAFARSQDLIIMTIQDDGQGFDPGQSVGEGHYGLQFMRERTETLGGSVRVESAPRKGTLVTVEIPVNKFLQLTGG